jgi:hypothetical protein
MRSKRLENTTGASFHRALAVFAMSQQRQARTQNTVSPNFNISFYRLSALTASGFFPPIFLHLQNIQYYIIMHETFCILLDTPMKYFKFISCISSVRCEACRHFRNEKRMCERQN